MNTLPFEVIQLIIDHCWPCRSYTSLLQVNSLFYSAALPQLYANPVLSIEILLAGRIGSLSTLKWRIDALKATLNQNAALCRQIHVWHSSIEPIRLSHLRTQLQAIESSLVAAELETGSDSVEEVASRTRLMAIT